jgi:hypothetical protein
MSTNQPTGRILLKDVRLAFPNLWEPNTVNGEGKPRYSASLLMGQDHAQVEEIKRKIETIAKDKWRDKAASILAGLYKTDKVALHDGDTKAQYDGFSGNMFVASAAQENAPPTVIDRDRSPLSQRSGRPYPGCYVNASLEFWAQDNGYGKRINCTLRGIQFYADGDSFSAGRPADSDEFDDVSAGADAEDFA